jgi:hypothetical protein
MRYLRRALPLAAVTVIVFGVVAISGRQTTAGATGGCADWSSIGSSRLVYGIRGLAALSDTDAWAVGAFKKTGSPPAVEHWDGTSWSVMQAPGLTRMETGFNAVTAISPTEAMAVGYANDGGGFRPLADVWDGTAWRSSPLPDALHSATLVDTAALGNDDVWAVGKRAVAGVQRPVMVHWSGSSWTIAPAPTTPGALLGLAATSPTDAWAVGYLETDEGETGLVMHFDGTRWTATTPPGLFGMVLTAASADAADDVWAVGYEQAGGGWQPVALRWDGTNWTVQAPADPGSTVAAYRAVDARSPDDVWAVGMRLDPARSAYGPLIEHWDGTAWTAETGAPAGGGAGGSELFAVDAAPGAEGVWASGRDALIEQYCSAGADSAHAVPATPKRVRPVSQRHVATDTPSPHTVAPGPAVPVVARDVASDAGVAETTHTYNAVVADFDGDGVPDIFLGRHTGAGRLYVNQGGGRFAEPAPGTFPATDRHGCAAADVNGDGSVELLCAHGARHGGDAKRNELWVRGDDGSWAERAASFGGMIEPFGRGRAMQILDANGDGRPDVIVVNNANRSDGLPTTTRLYLNRDGMFAGAPEFGIDGQFGSGCVVTGDVNGDGFDDVLACANKGIRLYISDGSRFTDATSAWGVSGKPRQATLADMNGDGLPDLVTLSSDSLNVALQSDGRFLPPSRTPLAGAVDLATGDVNGDGMTDVYTVTGRVDGSPNGPDVMLLNDGDGTGFTPMDVPSTSIGSAGSVVPIDYDGNGLTDFLVLNGDALHGTAGPVQLIAFFPSDGSEGRSSE